MWSFCCALWLGVGLLAFVRAADECYTVDWTFTKNAFVRCDDNFYLNALHRDGISKKLSDLSRGTCCPRPASPVLRKQEVISYADWDDTFDDRGWNSCPYGYFLTGLKRKSGDDNNLKKIRFGRCAKASDHPPAYAPDSCYFVDRTTNWKNNDKAETIKCANEDEFIVSLYRGDCHDLGCLERVKCCKFENPVDFASMDDVRDVVMQTNLRDLARLANFLGFGWCFGCRGEEVGEEFQYSFGSETWKAQDSSDCSGDKKDNRLHIKFDNWRYQTAEMIYGQTQVTELEAEGVDGGLIVNDNQDTATRLVSKTITSEREVTQETTKSETFSNDASFEVFYGPSSFTGGMYYGMGYSFSLDESTSKTDASGETQTKTLTFETEKTIEPYSAVNYTILLYKTKNTVPYTAVVKAEFSVKFSGFLRNGKSDKDPGRNFERDATKKSKQIDYDYTFGDADNSFTHELLEQSKYNKAPWIWTNIKSQYSNAQTVIDTLVGYGVDTFTVDGYFTDTIGTRLDISWTDVDYQTAKRRKRSDDDDPNVSVIDLGTHYEVAHVGKDDVSHPTPDYPEVTLPKEPDFILPPERLNHTSHFYDNITDFNDTLSA